jgi:sugar O-acyltransferase (sialic acid O-acetyltransferase NeuD family)
MKHLIIIGAGGMGRCLYNLARESKGYLSEFDIKGFLDDNLKALEGFDNYPPILSGIKEYQPQSDDVFTCSIGDVATKIKVCDALIAKGASFQTLIHKNANVGLNTKIGQGTIIDEGAHIDPDVIIGNNCLIQVQAIIGHDSVIGDNVRIDSQAFMVGGIKVGSGSCIYTKAMINHNVVIEENAVVGACSFVVKKVKAGTTVFGSPAKPIF